MIKLSNDIDLKKCRVLHPFQEESNQVIHDYLELLTAILKTPNLFLSKYVVFYKKGPSGVSNIFAYDRGTNIVYWYNTRDNILEKREGVYE